uniref:60S ribosome subunit biogenesis protein NIP7 pre-PUA domain-containing protein n=3 Tax=Canis lupus TaxID=9612 RepID=A0A8C0RUG5_CANLF
VRPLTGGESRVTFEKMAKYVGENLQRLHNDRVYYVSEKMLKLAANISGDKPVSLGTCFRKFTKSHRFRLHITALDYPAPYVPLGFGVAAKSTQGCGKVDPVVIVVFHQADIGECVRHEETLT